MLDRTKMVLLKHEQEIVDKLFINAEDSQKTHLAKSLIREAMQFLTKEDHMEMVTELVASIADFPNPLLEDPLAPLKEALGS